MEENRSDFMGNGEFEERKTERTGRFFSKNLKHQDFKTRNKIKIVLLQSTSIFVKFLTENLLEVIEPLVREKHASVTR